MTTEEKLQAYQQAIESLRQWNNHLRLTIFSTPVVERCWIQAADEVMDIVMPVMYLHLEK